MQIDDLRCFLLCSTLVSQGMHVFVVAVVSTKMLSQLCTEIIQFLHARVCPSKVNHRIRVCHCSSGTDSAVPKVVANVATVL